MDAGRVFFCNARCRSDWEAVTVGRKNDLVIRRQLEKERDMRIMRNFTVQLCADAAAIAANKVFHRKGDVLAEFLREYNRIAIEIATMTMDDAGADKSITYAKAKIDAALKELLGEHFQPWEVRYGDIVRGRR